MRALDRSAAEEEKLARIVPGLVVDIDVVFGYATAIRSLTRGRASYTMEPNHFERVPTFIQDKIVEKSQK